MDAIVAYDLSKQYGNDTALSGLNLQIPQGSAFACVGEELCGKTTLIRLLSGLCRPTGGECTVMGMSPTFESDRLHAITGTVLETARLYDNMTLMENMRFFTGIHNINSTDGLDRASFLLHKLDIWESRDEKVGTLPTGVVRRACAARALVHSPKVLLMDEPAGGLDKETADSMDYLMSYLVEEEGLTLLLCTRNMGYAQRLCNGYAILKGGALLAKGDLEALRKGAGVQYRMAMKLKDGENPLEGFVRENDMWVNEIASVEDVPLLISRAASQGKTIYEARLLEPTLEEIYQAYKEGRRRKAGDTDEQRDKNDGAADGDIGQETQPEQGETGADDENFSTDA